jgi:agmatinase
MPADDRADPPGPVGQVDALAVPRFAGLRTFARLPTLQEIPRADVAVLGAPFDSAATFRAGARFGPAAVREASLLLRPYNDALAVAPFARAQVADAGDAPASPIGVEPGHASIEAAARALTERGTRVVGLGGDHSVTLPLLRAAAARHGTLCLLQLDAHIDTWDSYFGARYTHGTVFRRALEEGVIDPHRSVQIGLRGSLYGAEDLEDNRALGFATLMARDFDRVGVSGALELARRRLRSPTYVTVDIDVLDPAFAPGTGTPEAGGLTSRELLALLRGLAELGVRLAGADVVEVSPPYDPSGVTAVAGANAAFELVSLLALEDAATLRADDQEVDVNEHEHVRSHEHDHSHGDVSHAHPHTSHHHEHTDHEHEHTHGDVTHSHPHTHAEGEEHDHEHSH